MNTPEGAFAAKRMGDYGKTMSKVWGNGLLEILGLEDTPFNPDHRFRSFSWTRRTRLVAPRTSCRSARVRHEYAVYLRKRGHHPVGLDAG